MSRFKIFHASFLRSTAIQSQNLSIDPLALLASQEADNAGSVDREPVAVEGGRMGSHLNTFAALVSKLSSFSE